MLNVSKVAICGGHLDTDVEQNNDELRVCVLNNVGRIFVWQQSAQQMTKSVNHLNL